MQLKLPFKTETKVYLVIEETLHSFTPLEVKPIKSVAERVSCYSSYYSRGTLYYSINAGVGSLVVGELTRL
jgi:hypothetical protein